MKKTPLFQLLIRRYPEIPEKELYARILCGEVKAEGETMREPDRQIPADAAIIFADRKYVSRGGEKLEFALKNWNIDVSGKNFVDAGSSTGGFSQVLLHQGASHVHAVDVGYNLLDYSLRSRKDVTVHERTNIMEIDTFTPGPDAGVVDISFRSAIPVIRHLLPLLKERWIIALIKPQFEWKDPADDFNGVVRSRERRALILEKVIHILWESRIFPAAVLAAPIPGRKGNREFLFHIKDSPTASLETILQKAIESTFS